MVKEVKAKSRATKIKYRVGDSREKREG